MSSFALKIIAITAMLIDHTGAILMENTDEYWIYRYIGRLAFPIFIFLLVEGLYHTRDVKKYLIRLGVFALISEIPYDMAFNHGSMEEIITTIKIIFRNMGNEVNRNLFIKLLQDNVMRTMVGQNIFFTLFLGLLLMALMRKVELKFQSKFVISYLLRVVLFAAACGLAQLIRCDYSYGGIVLITAFYIFRDNKRLIAITLPLIYWLIQDWGMDRNTFTLVFFATLSMAFITFYNGKKGKDIKYLFYIFYPAHLLILFLITKIILH